MRELINCYTLMSVALMLVEVKLVNIEEIITKGVETVVKFSLEKKRLSILLKKSQRRMM